MKKLSLDSSLYKKLHEIGNNIFENISSDVSLMNIATNMKKLVEITNRNIFESTGEEAYGRSVHYVVLDNINIIGEYLDNSIEVELLKNTFVGVFEILELANNKVVFLDITTGKKYDIIGEGEGNEYSLEKDFSVGDLLISRLIKLDDGYYNMKTFYFVVKNPDIKSYFEDLKLGYKHIFSGVRDLLDIEERMELINKNMNNNMDESNVNYLKRIKSILLKPIGKKQYKKIEKVFKKVDKNTYSNLLDVLSNYKIDKNILDEVKEYALLYIKENMKTPEGEKMEHLNNRLKMIMQSFSKILDDENLALANDRKATEKELKIIEDRKNKWFNEENKLFGNKTPMDFIYEIDPDYDISNLRFQQVSSQELSFYDGYNKYFTDEEKEIYEKSLEQSKNKNFNEAKILAEKLLKEHSGFFRLKANYISYFVNSIIDKYGNVRSDDFIKNISLEELETDFDFMLGLDKQLKELSILKKGYSIVGGENFPQIKKEFGPILRHLVGLKRKSIIDKLIIQKDEEGLIKKLREVIPDFDLAEYIIKVRKEGTNFVDYEGRIDEGLGYKEDDIWDILPYFWKKYKKKEDFIVDDIENMYKKIGVRKLKIDLLEKFNSFILENVAYIKSEKSKIRGLFNESIDYGEIEDPKRILVLIEEYGGDQEKRLKDDFEKSLDILGYYDDEY